jgi:uncharacterized membrane protein (DUF4010 family)
MDLALLHNLAIALGLGLLVGFERQRTAPEMAGVRTFALITMLGALMGTLAQTFGGGLVVVTIGALTVLLVTSNFIQLRRDEAEPGLTTEFAALVMFGVGAAVGADYRIAAAVLAGSVALLLHWKRPLHSLAQRIGEAEFRAAMRLVLIGLVILPVMPDRSFGPYGVLNPFQIWLMVVLIVGISLAGYVAYRVFGAQGGTLLGGALGGLISSTAATVGYARSARERPTEAGAATVMILVASCVVFVRILLEIALVAPGQFGGLGPPAATMLALLLALSALAWHRTRRGLADATDRQPPTNLRAAIIFGLLYGAILFAVALAKENFGTGAVFVVAAVSGLTDMDAITLSTARLVEFGQLDPATGWRVIIVAALANLLFKGGAVALIGPRPLARQVAAFFLAAVLAGVALVMFGPG